MRINRIFSIILLALFAVVPAAQQSGGNYVIIRLTPSYANVEIDSARCRAVDGVAQCLLSPGTHSFRISAPDFKTEEGTFEISPSFRTELNVKLKSYNALLRISAQDKDVVLSIDEKIIEGPDWENYVAPGTHMVRATKDNCQPFEQVVNIEAGGSSTVIIPELKKAKGSINVAMMPVDAEVYIDGAYKGLTPMVINDLDVGKYKIEIKKKHYDSLSRTVRVKEGRQTNMSGSLVGYTLVDLGLSVLWATANVGASDPTSEGDKVCWGALFPDEKNSRQIGYNMIGQGLVYGQFLSWDNDCAHKRWGDDYRMPTMSEVRELIYKCKWTYESVNNVPVARATGTNGNSIIFPLGAYWTRERNPEWSDSKLCAYDFEIYQKGDGTPNIKSSYYGDSYSTPPHINSHFMVRPVMSKPK